VRQLSPVATRAGLVILLLGGAYFAAQRWLQCTFPFGPSRWYPEAALYVARSSTFSR
jgi:hypothetical protein